MQLDVNIHSTLCSQAPMGEREVMKLVGMASLHTDCVERPLRLCFAATGRFIGSHPWWFLIAPLILSTGLGSGFYFLQDRMSNSIEGQFTPVDGRAKTERKYIQETFPGMNESDFSRVRLSSDGNYATFIASSHRNVLTVDALQDILTLDFSVRSMTVSQGNESFEYSDVCAVTMAYCTSNDILDIINHNATNIESLNLTYPWYSTEYRRFPLYLSLGGVTLSNESLLVEGAKAIQLYYYLSEEDKAKTDLWLERFIDLLSNESSSSSSSCIEVCRSSNAGI